MEEIILDEDILDTIKKYKQFELLIKAAANEDFDFVLNKYPNGKQVKLPEEVWDKVYDLLFHTNEDTIYEDDEMYQIENKRIHKFGDTYECV